MGKWSSYRKRGSAPQGGIQAAPIATDFSFGAPTVPNTSVNRLQPIPPPATQWMTMSVQVSNGAVAQGGANAATPLNLQTPLAATQYKGYVAYANAAGIRVSEWSLVGTVTTP